MKQTITHIDIEKNLKEMHKLAATNKIKLFLKLYKGVPKAEGYIEALPAVSLEKQVDELAMYVELACYYKLKLLPMKFEGKTFYKGAITEAEQIELVTRIRSDVDKLKKTQDYKKSFEIISKYRIKGQGTSFKGYQDRSMYLNIKEALEKKMDFDEQMNEYVKNMRDIFFNIADKAEEVVAAVYAYMVPYLYEYKLVLMQKGQREAAKVLKAKIKRGK